MDPPTVAPESPPWWIGRSRAGDDARIAPTGEIDLERLPDLRAALGWAEGTDAACVVIDLRETTFLDVRALGTLLLAHHRMEIAGRGLLLVPGPRQVRRLFAVSRLEETFYVVDD